MHNIDYFDVWTQFNFLCFTSETIYSTIFVLFWTLAFTQQSLFYSEICHLLNNLCFILNSANCSTIFVLFWTQAFAQQSLFYSELWHLLNNLCFILNSGIYSIINLCFILNYICVCWNKTSHFTTWFCSVNFNIDVKNLFKLHWYNQWQ